MNNKQRRTVVIGLAVVLLIVLFPPWLYFDGNTSNQASAGYRFLLNRPNPSTYEEMFGIPEDEFLTTMFVRVRLNFHRLITQLVFAIFLITGLVLRFGKARSWSHGFFAVAFWAAILFVLLLFVRF